jgi:Ser/Thr protein kinase RdoA (MazF antagonist)
LDADGNLHPPEGAAAAPGYAALTPPQVLQALDDLGLPGDGRILQLNSYENRVFQLFLDDGRAIVAKCYRPGRWSDAQILEEHAFALELAADEVAVVPPLVLHLAPAPGNEGGSDPTGDDGNADSHARRPVLLGEPPTLARLGHGPMAHRIALAARCAGREPELDQPETLRQLGRFIGRLHAVGRRAPFLHRRTLQPARDGAQALATVLDGGFVPAPERPAWHDAATRALQAVAGAFERHGALALLRLHGDCHPGNVLWRFEGEGTGPHLVDLDDAVNGPAVQDLWMLVAGDAATQPAQWRWLLDGYEQFGDFDDRERALVEPLRTLRMLRHSAWLAERWGDPTFPLNFPFFGSAAYWNQQTALLREQVENMTGA